MSTGALWSEIETLTKDILEDAVNEAWVSCQEKVEQRQELLHRYFKNSPSAADAERIRQEIQRILSCDEEITSLCQKEFSRLRDELQQFDKERSAARAYRH